MSKKLTTKEWVEKAINVHGDEYDYSKVNYTVATQKICIICNKHGEFWQIPRRHIQGEGCPKCAIEKRANQKRLSEQEFIKRAKEIYPQYNYDKVKYKNYLTKVIIECPIHGNFEIAPGNLLSSKQGCAKCHGGVSIDTNEFKIRALKVHGNRYDYSNVDYINSRTLVDIICRKHGNFQQTPANHLSGQGCPICSLSKGEQQIIQILNEHEIDYIHQYKVVVNNKTYYIDFYVPDYKLYIEYNGKQHYEYIPYFHEGCRTLEEQQERDEIIRNYCKDKGELLEIPYNMNTKEVLYAKFNWKYSLGTC